MDDPELWLKFYNYLDKSNDSWMEKATSEIGLIKDAPIEAIEAYKEYKKYEKERDPDRE